MLDARLAGAYLSLVLLFFVVTRLFGARAKRLQKEVGGWGGGWVAVSACEHVPFIL